MSYTVFPSGLTHTNPRRPNYTFPGCAFYLFIRVMEITDILSQNVPVLSENANGAARSNPRGVLKTRGDQPTRLCLLFIHPRAPNLISSPVCQHHAGMISSFVRTLISAFKARRKLALENVALRQQLAVLRRSVKRTRLSNVDRGFWVLLRRIWTDWESVLVIVKPETVVRWHRCGFRRYWAWKSRRRRPGRPGVAPEIRELIRNMSRATLSGELPACMASWQS